MPIEEPLNISPVIPVTTVEDASTAADLARALVRGGIRIIEITLRTSEALRAIEAVVRGVPQIVVAAGTVLSFADLQRAATAGASLAISPGTTPALLEQCADAQIPYLPSVATASELMAGIAANYRYFKLFPASTLGGPALLKALASPFPMARFCPTGGITQQTAKSYLELGNVTCVGGSWITPREAIANKDWARIAALAAKAVSLRSIP